MSKSVCPTPTAASGVLAFTQSCARPQVSPFAYAYTSRARQPLAYCSAYAAMARDLAGDLALASEAEKRAWVDYLNSFQCEDGLFRDPAFGLPDDLSGVPFAPDAGWDGGIAGWGWWHMTNHILCALDSLGGVAARPIRLLEDFYSGRIVLEDWLAARDWNVAWAVGNEVLNLGAFLLYARDFHHEDRARDLVVRLFDWLDAHQDRATGFWASTARAAPASCTPCAAPITNTSSTCTTTAPSPTWRRPSTPPSPCRTLNRAGSPWTAVPAPARTSTPPSFWSTPICSLTIAAPTSSAR
ncbi:hypothetical protein HS125_00755 [bacterium]|nr:hypothetical protein [bacterium]